MLGKIYYRLRLVYFYVLSLFFRYYFRVVISNSSYTNVKFFRKESWHDGFIYFTAINRKRNKVFIKCSFHYKELMNEVFFYKKIKRLIIKNEILKPTVVNSLIGYIISFPFVESTRGFSSLTNSEVSSLVDDVFLLNKNGVVLRDFKPDNVLLNGDYLIFIDFTFAHNIEEDDNFITLKSKYVENNLGADCRPSSHCWDDAYSLLYFLEDLKLCKNIMERVNSNVGKNLIYLSGRGNVQKNNK